MASSIVIEENSHTLNSSAMYVPCAICFAFNLKPRWKLKMPTSHTARWKAKTRWYGTYLLHVCSLCWYSLLLSAWCFFRQRTTFLLCHHLFVATPLIVFSKILRGILLGYWLASRLVISHRISLCYSKTPADYMSSQVVVPRSLRLAGVFTVLLGFGMSTVAIGARIYVKLRISRQFLSEDCKTVQTEHAWEPR